MNAKLFWLLVPKADAERLYDPADVEQGVEVDGWVGVVSACSPETLAQVAKFSGIRGYKVREVL